MKTFTAIPKGLVALGVMVGMMSPAAQARLIFTTEEDGTPTASWTIDQGDIYNDVDLFFGTTGVGINYNFTDGLFTFSDEVQMKVENSTGAPNTCSATESGQMYFDTATALLYFCDGSTWTTTNNASTLTLNDGQFFVGDATNTAVAVTPTGDVTFDNTGTFDITADAVTGSEILDGAVDTADIADDAITNAKLDDDAVTTTEILDGTIDTLDLADNSVSLGKITDGPANQVLTTDASGNPTWESRLNFLSSTLNDGQFLVGDATNTAVAVTASGDVTFDNTGTFDITANAVTTAEILDGTVTFDDIAAREASATEAPEFKNFTLQSTTLNNRGTMEADHDTASNKNFYKWSTRRSGSAQQYDIVMQWMVPENFQGFSTTAPAPIEVDYKTDTTSTADNVMTITLEDSTGASVAVTGGTNLVSTTADTWVEDTPISFTGGTFTPGEYLTLRFTMMSQATSAVDPNPVFLGPVKFNYTAK